MNKTVAQQASGVVTDEVLDIALTAMYGEQFADLSGETEAAYRKILRRGLEAVAPMMVRVPEQATPEIGSYVLATKYSDGDPGDHWGVGWYDGERNGRHYVKDGAGNQIRGNGFRRVGNISREFGGWLLGIAAPVLERSPAGMINLWSLVAAAPQPGGKDGRA